MDLRRPMYALHWVTEAPNDEDDIRILTRILIHTSSIQSTRHGLTSSLNGREMARCALARCFWVTSHSFVWKHYKIFLASRIFIHSPRSELHHSTIIQMWSKSWSQSWFILDSRITRTICHFFICFKDIKFLVGCILIQMLTAKVWMLYSCNNFGRYLKL